MTQEISAPMPDADYCEIQVGGHRANSRRFTALVDVADVKVANAYRWSMSDGYAKWYGSSRVEGKRLIVFMHRELLGLTTGDPRDVDHVNGDKLDNRRANLRVCAHAQNTQNLHQCGPYRGATWHAGANRWRAEVKLAGKNHYLGLFDTQEQAAAVASAFRREHMPFSADAREQEEHPP